MSIFNHLQLLDAELEHKARVARYEKKLKAVCQRRNRTRRTLQNAEGFTSSQTLRFRRSLNRYDRAFQLCLEEAKRLDKERGRLIKAAKNLD